MLDIPADIPFHHTHSTEYIQLCSMTIPNNYILASIVKLSQKRDPNLTYHQLRCTPEDLAKIHKLITTIGSTGKLVLLGKMRYLRRIGDELIPVPPLKFLGVVFSNPNLKKHMKEVMDDYWKRNNFIDGLAPRLEAEFIKGYVDLYLEDFCKDVHANKSTVRAYIMKKDYRGFLDYLCQL